MSKNIYKSDTDDTVSEGSFDSTGKKKSFRRVITRFAEKTSMVGPPYINMAKLWWAKLIWAFLLLCAVVAMLLHLWYLFSQWYSWPKTTVISLGFDNLQFPQVTICNTNVLHKNRFDKYKGSKELKELIKDLKPLNFVPHQFDDNYDPIATNKNDPLDNNGGDSEPTGNHQNGTTKPGSQNNPGTTKPGSQKYPGTTKPGSQNNPGTTKPGSQNNPGTTKPGSQNNPGTTKPSSQNNPGTTKPGSQNNPGTTVQATRRPESTVPGGNKLGEREESDSTARQTKQTSTEMEATTTAANSQAPDRRTTQSRQRNSGEPSDQGKTSPKPHSRQKRFNRNYMDLNLTKYHQHPEEFDEDGSSLTSPIDSQTKVEKIFRELYMDIDKPIRKSLGHNIDDMLVGCTFNGRQCDTGDFQLHQTSEYGNCWTIASDKFVVRNAGPTGGLSIVLFLETAEYLKGLTTGHGARVQFQQRDTYPFPYDEGVFVSGAMETDIGLKFRTITRLGGDFGSCNDGVEFMKLYNLTYTRRACQAFCRLSSVINICKCFNDKWEEFAFKNNNTLKPCRSHKEKVCEREVVSQYGSGQMSCKCDNPCGEIEYVKSVSGRQWPTDEYSRVLLDWLCDKDAHTCSKLRGQMSNMWNVKNNFLKINIYYEDLNFENITETATIEIQQFLSDIGGAFGLWIGLSVLSLCEVIQLFIELCDYGIHKTKEEQNTKPKSNDKKTDPDPDYPVNDGNGKLPRIMFGQLDKLPHHLRDEKPFHDQNSSNHSDTDSYESPYSRRRHFDIFGSQSPNLRTKEESHYPRRSPLIGHDRHVLEFDRYGNKQKYRRRSRSHDPPRRDHDKRDLFDNYSNYKDNLGIDRPSLFY